MSWQRFLAHRLAAGLVGFAIGYVLLGALFGFRPRTLEYLLLATLAMWLWAPVAVRDYHLARAGDGGAPERVRHDTWTWVSFFGVFVALFFVSRQESLYAALPWWLIAGAAASYFLAALLVSTVDKALASRSTQQGDRAD